jgi:quercetin dioxygenase-like cupin family protein
MTIGDEVRSLRAGDWSVVEGDVPHGIRAGDAGARIVAVIVPRRTGVTAYVVHE